MNIFNIRDNQNFNKVVEDPRLPEPMDIVFDSTKMKMFSRSNCGLPTYFIRDYSTGEIVDYQLPFSTIRKIHKEMENEKPQKFFHFVQGKTLHVNRLPAPVQ